MNPLDDSSDDESFQNNAKTTDIRPSMSFVAESSFEDENRTGASDVIEDSTKFDEASNTRMAQDQSHMSANSDEDSRDESFSTDEHSGELTASDFETSKESENENSDYAPGSEDEDSKVASGIEDEDSSNEEESDNEGNPVKLKKALRVIESSGEDSDSFGKNESSSSRNKSIPTKKTRVIESSGEDSDANGENESSSSRNKSIPTKKKRVIESSGEDSDAYGENESSSGRNKSIPTKKSIRVIESSGEDSDASNENESSSGRGSTNQSNKEERKTTQDKKSMSTSEQQDFTHLDVTKKTTEDRNRSRSSNGGERRSISERNKTSEGKRFSTSMKSGKDGSMSERNITSEGKRFSTSMKSGKDGSVRRSVTEDNSCIVVSTSQSPIEVVDSDEEYFNEKRKPSIGINSVMSSTRIDYREVNSMASSASESASGTMDIISDSEEEFKPEVTYPPKAKMKQPTIQQMFTKTLSNNTSANVSNVSSNVSIDKAEVSREEYQMQKEKVARIQTDLRRVKNLLNTIKLSALPDQGKQLLDSHKKTMDILASEEEKLKKMSVNHSLSKSTGISDISDPIITLPKPASWQDLQSNAGAVQPRTFGAKALATHNLQKALTMDRLQQLHGSLKTCPAEDMVAEDPKGLKVDLMPHQKHALAWLLWREKQKPSGGILADDMGLGKTLTMISLMMKTNEQQNDDDEKENSDDEDPEKQKRYKYYGGTLVVCPASLLNQWAGEVGKRVQRGLVSIELYHGTKRETKPKRLANYDMVITTYSIVMNELKKDTPLFKIKWERIILDEAHQIRNHKSGTSIAACELSAKSRWALTGTPIHNKEVDLYSLLKFLRCSPFDDLQIFKRWATEKSSGGQERLNTVMSSIMLRRTKAQLQQKGSLDCLPERTWEIIEVTLEKQEMNIYQKILVFSKTLFSQFLHQKAEKNTDRMMPLDVRPTFSSAPIDPNGEYFKMHKKLVKMNKMKEVKQHEILVLLLRLRQVCCHPHLITAMLDDGTLEASDVANEVEDTELDAMNLLDQLNKMNLEDDDDGAIEIAQDCVGLAEATRGVLKLSNPLFNNQRQSTKVKEVINLLKERIVDTGDKCIIVSQWTSFLKLIAVHLEKEGIFFDQLDGTVQVSKRPIIVDNFNNPATRVKVLLLSLTAGGVGLNLVGANHLLLLDLHWNPQLEMQAQDRIYRVGQKKHVYIYKFMTLETIEERIKALQDHKKDIAEGVLTGAKMQNSKLSLDDLKMLFEM